jgi:hypothetical protein
MKKLREIVRSHAEEEIEKEADSHIQGVAPDLPKQGNYQYASAIDHLADTLYDKFPQHRETHDLKKIAKRVVSRYFTNDTQLSKRNEAKQERAWARAEKLRNSPPKLQTKETAKSM